jgi:hypothetical protein
MTTPQEAPHFTKELLIDSMRHLRADFVTSLSNHGVDKRARTRLAGARRLGLDKVNDDAIADRTLANILAFERGKPLGDNGVTSAMVK